jgi:hypothetical protein
VGRNRVDDGGEIGDERLDEAFRAHNLTSGIHREYLSRGAHLRRGRALIILAMNIKLIAYSIVVLLVSLRAGCEYGMMSAHGPDAQMGIWYMFMIVQLAFWLITGFVAAILLGAAWSKRWWKSAALALFLVWITAVCLSSFRFYDARRALVDASAPTTSAERIRELVKYDGLQAGYELDNRLASNPSTPPEILRFLHGQPDQVGTEMCLASNPNTPDDILRALGERNDEWSKYIIDSLKRNPRYDEVFGDRN